jgi:hypothetical protein
VSSSMWNPPTGPPNGVPLRPAEARREVEAAVAAARARDAELRAAIAAEAGRSIHTAAALDAAAAEADDAAELAMRALERSHQSARAGQRAEAAKWTAAAQVFAMRLRDARARVAALEAETAAGTERTRRAEVGLTENVRRLEAVLAARLPMVPGRKGARLQAAADEAVAGLSRGGGRPGRAGRRGRAGAGGRPGQHRAHPRRAAGRAGPRRGRAGARQRPQPARRPGTVPDADGA